MGELAGLAILLTIGAATVLVTVTWIMVWGVTHPPRHTAGYAVARGLPCDPGELDLAVDSWTLDRPDGASLPVWEVARKAEAGLTAVFVHGWGQSRIDMLARRAPWDELCDRLVFYDLRGHGEAAGSISRLGHREDDDLIAILERLGGEGRFVFVGHSMGAVIAINAAAMGDDRLRDRLAGLVCYAPYIDFDTAMCGQLRLHGYPARPFTDLALGVLRARGVRPPSCRESPSRVAAPMLVIHSDDDPVAPLADAKFIASLAPNATLHRVDSDMHEPPDAQTVVREFILGLS